MLRVNYIEACLMMERYDELTDWLKRSFNVKSDPESGKITKLDVKNEDVDNLANILHRLSTTTMTKQLKLLTETYRSLRNCCVNNRDVQTKLTEHELISNATLINYETINLILARNRANLILNRNIPTNLQDVNNAEVNGVEGNLNEETLKIFANYAKMLLQFLTNLIVGNAKASETIYHLYSSRYVTLLNNKTTINETCALLYNHLVINDDLDLTNDLIDVIFDVYEYNTIVVEYLTFLIDYCANVRTYKRLNTKRRVVILTQIKAYLNETNDYEVDEHLTMLFVDDFKKKSDCILKTVDTYLNEIEPIEVSLLTEVLSSLSVKKLTFLQEDRSLLINCVFLLKSVHDLGRECANNFSVIGKLSCENDAHEYNEHPAFGFKANLIRILGNLCWKCKRNQEELRELDCVPLLLDCCNMDARNPFIIQWCVFAIRNLCEDNVENQRLIASMTKRGVVNASVLNQMGLTLEDDAQNKIKIVPLDALK